ncbi:MAG: DNA replication/repair protein RecF [Spirochaetales bacterium]|nr:DNA replication/repair protein RecF [Spirochaetales bacterium]
MGFSSIRFLHYRNLKDSEIPVHSPVVFLIGENGQGKTNFIEGLYYLCFGSSFRTRINERIIKNGEDFAFLTGTFFFPDNIESTVSVQIFKNKNKEIKVDNKLINDRKEIIQNIPCIAFSHDDMIFVKGPPEQKRWFLNQTLSLFEPVFIDLLRDYRKNIKNRNICLKSKRTDMISIYNEKIAVIGLEIQKKRKILIDDFNKTFLFYYKAISGLDKDIRIIYYPSWKGADNPGNVIDILHKKYPVDMEFGITTSGPHRDTIYFYEGKKNFVLNASTGQLRLLSIVLRIAQARYFYEKTGKKPVLLVDDVLLELDYVKRMMFYKRLTDYEQIFFTFLPDESFIESEKGDILKYYIENGEVKPWKKQVIS